MREASVVVRSTRGRGVGERKYEVMVLIGEQMLAEVEADDRREALQAAHREISSLMQHALAEIETELGERPAPVAALLRAEKSKTP
jgi:hypothetical protein